MCKTNTDISDATLYAFTQTYTNTYTTRKKIVIGPKENMNEII